MMKILLLNSFLLSSALAWPVSSWWQTGPHFILANLPGVASSVVNSEPNFVTSEVKVEDVVKTIMATGALIPSLNIEVGSVLSGQLSKLKVDFNDKVVKGQVLAELDPRSFELAVTSGQAALEGAKADLKGAVVRLDRARIQAKQAVLERTMMATRVDRAKLAFDLADREY